MGAMRRPSRAWLLLLAAALPACGSSDDDALPQDAQALRQLHRTQGEAGRFDEAGRALQALTDMADHDGARAQDLEALAGAWDDRLRDGVRLGETAWITQALAVLDRAARRPSATETVERMRLDALVLRSGFARTIAQLWPA